MFSIVVHFDITSYSQGFHNPITYCSLFICKRERCKVAWKHEKAERERERERERNFGVFRSDNSTIGWDNVRCPAGCFADCCKQMRWDVMYTFSSVAIKCKYSRAAMKLVISQVSPLEPLSINMNKRWETKEIDLNLSFCPFGLILFFVMFQDMRG